MKKLLIQLINILYLKHMLKKIDITSVIKNLFKNPKKTLHDIFFHEFLWVVQISHSSTWEDVILDWLIKKDEWFYVDIWWYSPIFWNNTYLFYKKWWNWIVVEPNKTWLQKFITKRPRDLNLQLWIGKNNWELIFNVFDSWAMSTCDLETAKRYTDAWAKIIDKYIVPIWTLEKLFDEYVKDKEIDILSVDVEWWDMDVLESNNWEKYKPNYIILETVEYGKNWANTWTKENDKFDPYLESKWYSVIAETWINTIYKLNK